jgi:O-antigen/teichoic acid export membrane protein
MRDRRYALSKNTLFNILGAILPLGLTLLAVPVYLRLIGDVRFGALALIWVLLMYFGLFDLGLGRATSKYIAELGDANSDKRESLFWTALIVNLGLGVLGGILLCIFGRFILGLFKLPDALRAEIANAVPWLGIAVPLFNIISVFVGTLEGLERFFTVNAWTVIADWAFRILPLIVAYVYGPDLRRLVPAAIISRALVIGPMFLACRKYVPVNGVPRFERRWIRRIFTYGGWISVSGVVNPLLMSIDRFVIGMVQGTAAVTYYSVPFSFASKFLIIPVSISRTLFPRVSASEENTALDLTRSAVLSTAIFMTPMVAVAILLVRPFFHIWLGLRVADLSAPIGEIMLLGAWMNGLLHVPSVYLQGRGRPDLTAKLHVFELLPFLAMLWAGLRLGGTEGAAWAWSLRLTGHFILLFAVVRLGWRLAAILVIPAGMLALCVATVQFCPEDILVRAGLIAIVLTACLIWGVAAAPPSLRTLAVRASTRFMSVTTIPAEDSLSR